MQHATDEESFSSSTSGDNMEEGKDARVTLFGSDDDENDFSFMGADLVGFLNATLPNGLELSKDAPAHHPRIIDTSRLSHLEIEEYAFVTPYESAEFGVCAADAIATVLYQFRPLALQRLLDLTEPWVEFSVKNSSNFETYVRRRGYFVTVSVG
jgi:hypothetical protein